MNQLSKSKKKKQKEKRKSMRKKWLTLLRIVWSKLLKHYF